MPPRTHISTLQERLSETNPWLSKLIGQCRTHLESAKTGREVFDLLHDTTYQPGLEVPPKLSQTDWWVKGKTWPPQVTQLASPFRIINTPDLLKRQRAIFETQFKYDLDSPLSAEFMDNLAEEEALRMDAAHTAIVAAPQSPQGAGEIDVHMYANLMTTVAQMFPVYMVQLPGLSPKCFRSYREIGPHPSTCIVSMLKKHDPFPYLLRLLYIPSLDVIPELYNIASVGLAVEKITQTSRDGTVSSRARWHHSSQPVSVKARRAREILVWLFDSAYELNVPFIKLSDGLNHIWFEVRNGELRVGPLMKPLWFKSDGDVPPPYQTESLSATLMMMACISSNELSSRLATESVVFASPSPATTQPMTSAVGDIESFEGSQRFGVRTRRMATKTQTEKSANSSKCYDSVVDNRAYLQGLHCLAVMSLRAGKNRQAISHVLVSEVATSRSISPFGE